MGVSVGSAILALSAKLENPLPALPAHADPLVEATALRAQWEKAFNAWNFDQLVALYAEDAQFFGSTPQLNTGRDSIRAYFSKLPAGAWNARMGEHAVTSIGSGVLLSAGFVDFTHDGKALPYRLTFVLVKRGETWLIAQHHASPKG